MFLIFARIQCGRGMRRYLPIFVSWLQIITRRRRVMTYRANLELTPCNWPVLYDGHRCESGWVRAGVTILAQE